MSVGLKIILVFLMTISGSLGAYFFKRGTESLQGKSFFYMILVPYIWIGGCFYILGIISNVILLRYLDYTIVYPMTALTYIWTLFISHLLLKEKIDANKVLAIALIVAGIVVINL